MLFDRQLGVQKIRKSFSQFLVPEYLKLWYARNETSHFIAVCGTEEVSICYNDLGLFWFDVCSSLCYDVQRDKVIY